MEPLTLGLVGLGWWGGVLARAAATTEAARLTACFARTRESREAFAEEHGCRAASSMDDLLADDEVEALLIATPHTTHLELIEAAARAGKHVYVEKPMTLTVAEGKRCIEAAEEAGVVLQVGHQRRRQPANRRIKELIDPGELGPVVQLTGQMSAPGRYAGFPPWRYDPVESPAGGMTGLGIHLADTYHYFVGPVRRLFAVSKPLVDDDWEMDDATSVILEFESGPVGHLATSYRVPKVDYLTVYGDDGVAWNLLDGKQLLVQRRGETEPTEVPLPDLDVVADELAELARCVREGEQPETGGPEGLEAVVILEAIVASAERGQSVEVDEFR